MGFPFLLCVLGIILIDNWTLRFYLCCTFGLVIFMFRHHNVRRQRDGGKNFTTPWISGKCVVIPLFKTRNTHTYIQHLGTCSVCKAVYSVNNFKVVDSAKNDFDCCIKEALHIKFNRPTLNTQLATQGMSYFLNTF